MTEEQVQPAAEESSKPEAGVAEGEKIAAERRIGELEGALAQLQQQMEGEVAAFKGQLASAAAKYRALILASAPEVPEELVRGETPEEVEASFAAAREMVAKVRRQLEAKVQAQRVPAGAPARTPVNLGALSPQEKIAYALSRTK